MPSMTLVVSARRGASPVLEGFHLLPVSTSSPPRCRDGRGRWRGRSVVTLGVDGVRESDSRRVPAVVVGARDGVGAGTFARRLLVRRPVRGVRRAGIFGVA